MLTVAPVAFNQHYRLPRRLVRREPYILSCCAGKRVLHLGCVDFVSAEDWRGVLASERWLHAKIERVAQEVVGVDNAAEAVRLLREQMGVTSVIVGDAQCLDRLDAGTFDVILAGEVLEHLPCPGSMLASARSILRPGGSVIITTTNAYCLRRFLRVACGSESVHPDHVAYFSHRTLRSLAEMYGYRVVEQFPYRLPNRRPLLPYLIERVGCAIAPNLGEGILCRLEKA